eukprot:1688464-Amphidinium_carterae.1
MGTNTNSRVLGIMLALRKADDVMSRGVAWKCAVMPVCGCACALRARSRCGVKRAGDALKGQRLNGRRRRVILGVN